MAPKSEVERLRNLAQMDADAVGAYDAAIARVKQPTVRERLNEFRVDHVRHVQDLNALIRRFGGEPVELKPDLKGAAMRGLTSVTGLIGTEGALVAMLGNEELVARAYAVALGQEWSGEVKEALEQNRKHEERHLLWLREAVLKRPWADEEAQARV
jgi:rubrerythrin